MCHTLLEIPKKRANINHWLLFMKVVNVSQSSFIVGCQILRRVFGVRLLHHCVRILPLRSLSRSRATSLASAFCYLVREYDITLPFDPHSHKSADWMIGL